MERMKRFLSALLAVAMLMSMVVLPVSAEGIAATVPNFELLEAAAAEEAARIAAEHAAAEEAARIAAEQAAAYGRGAGKAICKLVAVVAGACAGDCNRMYGSINIYISIFSMDRFIYTHSI